MLTWHDYRIFILSLTDEALLLSIFISLPVIIIQLALIDQVRAQFELTFIL